MTEQEIKENAPEGETHYIDDYGFCYCKFDAGWQALEYGEWITCDNYWIDKIKPL